MKKWIICFLVGALAVGITLVIYIPIIPLIEFVFRYPIESFQFGLFIWASFLAGHIILKILEEIKQKDNQ